MRRGRLSTSELSAQANATTLYVASLPIHLRCQVYDLYSTFCGNSDRIAIDFSQDTQSERYIWRMKYALMKIMNGSA